MHDSIVGYMYKAEQYTPSGLIWYMVQNGELSPAAIDMDTEWALDQHAGANAIDRDDEWSFDSDDFPKVILSYMTEGNPEYDTAVNEHGDYVLL